MSMQRQVRIEAIEKQAVIVLPPDLLKKLHADIGDRLDVVETAAGLELRSARTTAEEQLEAAEEILRVDQEVLRKLAQ